MRKHCLCLNNSCLRILRHQTLMWLQPQSRQSILSGLWNRYSSYCPNHRHCWFLPFLPVRLFDSFQYPFPGQDSCSTSWFVLLLWLHILWDSFFQISWDISGYKVFLGSISSLSKVLPPSQNECVNTSCLFQVALSLNGWLQRATSGIHQVGCCRLFLNPTFQEWREKCHHGLSQQIRDGPRCRLRDTCPFSQV